MILDLSEAGTGGYIGHIDVTIIPRPGDRLRIGKKTWYVMYLQFSRTNVVSDTNIAPTSVLRAECLYVRPLRFWER